MVQHKILRYLERIRLDYNSLLVDFDARNFVSSDHRRFEEVVLAVVAAGKKK